MHGGLDSCAVDMHLLPLASASTKNQSRVSMATISALKSPRLHAKVEVFWLSNLVALFVVHYFGTIRTFNH
jgi:hypothetical protein